MYYLNPHYRRVYMDCGYACKSAIVGLVQANEGLVRANAELQASNEALLCRLADIARLEAKGRAANDLAQQHISCLVGTVNKLLKGDE